MRFTYCKNNILKLLALVLSLCLLVGCAAKGDPDSDRSGADNGYSQNDDGTDLPGSDDGESGDDYYVPDPDYETVPGEILSRKFALTEAQISTLNETVNALHIAYEKSEFYCVDENLTKYDALQHAPVSSAETVMIKDNKVDYNTLLVAVKNNNKQLTDAYYHGLSEACLEKTVKLVAETVNYNLACNPYINKNVLDHKLQNLKVLGYSDFGYAFYSYTDRVLALNVDSIESVVKFSPQGFEELICHEAGHLLQDVAITREDSVEMNYGMCYQFRDNPINALYWIWLVEGAAENGALLQNDIPVAKAVTYDSYVKALNSLTASYALNQQNVYELQYLTSQKEIQPLFRLFGCQTMEDRYEILYMMVALNLCLETSDTILSDNLFKHMQVTDTEEFAKSLKSSIGQTLSKVFYRNLIDKLSQKEVTLEDAFSLMAVFEIRMSNELWYDESGHAKYMGKFYENYLRLQDGLFKEIATALQMTEGEVRDYYTNYFHTTNFGQWNNNLLNDQQNAFYKKLYTDLLSPNALTVFEAAGTRK